MAYLIKDARGRSPFWYGIYQIVLPGGERRWVRKSTKKCKRAEAKEILDAWQKTADQAAAGFLDEARMREIMAETVARITGKRIDAPTIGEWLNRWLASERGAVAPQTMLRYEQIVRDFVASLGPVARSPLESLSADPILAFRDERLKDGLSPRSVNQTFKILKRPFKIAVDQGLIDRNPVAALRTLRGTVAKKGVFTPEQIRLLVDTAEGDWKGLILAGYFTGGRLTDLARLTWSNIDLSERTILFVQKKTGAEVKVPIHPDLYDHLSLLPGVDGRPDKPVFPALFKKPGAGKSGLSMAFKRIMERAGIADGVARQKIGEKGRNVSALSFHSLRHSFTSAMANANVPAEIRQKLTGHADSKSHVTYTHHELATVRRAIDSVPRLPKQI
jgi:integrase